MRTPAVIVLAVLGTALAAVPPTWAAGDAAAGRAKAGPCLGCHGIPGYRNAYPVYPVPKLGGQHAEYIVIALTGYKNGQRAHGTMHAQAATLSQQDMEDLAAFFAGVKTGEVQP
jgi:cytochrome c553